MQTLAVGGSFLQGHRQAEVLLEGSRILTGVDMSGKNEIGKG